jgi:hypothetical protein
VGSLSLLIPAPGGLILFYKKHLYNTGIIVSHSIKYAMELIQNNPIGIEIK